MPGVNLNFSSMALSMKRLSLNAWIFECESKSSKLSLNQTKHVWLNSSLKTFLTVAQGYWK